MSDPSQSLPDDELASAALDGELDADARARVTSPGIAERVDTYRRVQHLVSDNAAPADATRERAIAAALDAFDEAAAGASAASAGNVRTLTRHRWQRTLVGLGAAAAIALVVGVAVNLARDDRGGRESSTAAGDASKSTQEGSPAFSVPRPTIGSITGPVSVAQVIDSPAALHALGATNPPEVAAGSTPGTTPGPLAGGTMAAQGTGQDTPQPCTGPRARFLADIIYRGTPAIAVIDDTTRAVSALDPARGCSVLATAP